MDSGRPDRNLVIAVLRRRPRPGAKVRGWCAILREMEVEGDQVHRPFAFAEELAIGDGISLRRWRDSDAESLAAACDDPEIARWLPVPSPYTLDSARHYLRRTETWWERDERYAFAISDGSAVLGAISLSPYEKRPAIGYWLATSARGRGIMTRAVRAIAAWGRETFGLSEAWIFVQPDNDRSSRVARRAGFEEQAERVAFPDGKERAAFRRRLEAVQ